MFISSRAVNTHDRNRQFLFLVRQFKNKSSPLKPLGQMNRNLVESIYERSSIMMFISFRSVNKHCRHRQFLFLIDQFLSKNLLLACTKLLWRHRQFLFVISQLKYILLFGQLNCNLVGSTHGRLCKHFSQSNLEGSETSFFCKKKKSFGLLGVNVSPLRPSDTNLTLLCSFVKILKYS